MNIQQHVRIILCIILTVSASASCISTFVECARSTALTLHTFSCERERDVQLGSEREKEKERKMNKKCCEKKKSLKLQKIILRFTSHARIKQNTDFCTYLMATKTLNSHNLYTTLKQAIKCNRFGCSQCNEHDDDIYVQKWLRNLFAENGSVEIEILTWFHSVRAISHGCHARVKLTTPSINSNKTKQ